MTFYQKTGYLYEDLRLFRLSDVSRTEFTSHYHDFHKILIFLDGNASYFVEGKTYHLKPQDIVLVPAGSIHRPILHGNTPYERIIIYIAQQFFDRYKTPDYDLFTCFHEADLAHSHLVQLRAAGHNKVRQAIAELDETFRPGIYARDLRQRTQFLNFLILLNSLVVSREACYPDPSVSNPRVLKILDYINTHITEDLTVDVLADTFYLNRSYLMHLFKSSTGYTVVGYLTEKRLFAAKKMIQEGVPVTEACYRSGFRSYASFYRAFVEKFNCSPKKYFPPRN